MTAGLAAQVFVMRRAGKVVVQIGVEEYLQQFLRDFRMDVFVHGYTPTMIEGGSGTAVDVGLHKCRQ